MNYKIGSFLVFFLLLASCTSNPFHVDVSKVEVSITAKRFEQDLFSISPDSLYGRIPSLRSAYKNFFELFCRRVIHIPSANDSALAVNLGNFIRDPDIRGLYKECSAKYPSVKNLEQDLSDAFSHYRYYFPEKPVPQVLTFISGFNYAIVSTDSILGIGLDMYLGGDHKDYAALGYPKFKSKKMSREYIAVDCMKGWLESEYEPGPEGKDFLGTILYEGKILYLLDALLPDVDDTLKMGYSAEQLKFCKNNEVKIWSLLIGKKVLFSTNEMEYMKYVNEGPTTAGLPSESPAQLGIWIGWQIIRKYMRENSGITLKQLMMERDAQKILRLSRYKPVK